MGAILVTGAAGFIGMHLCSRLLKKAQSTDVIIGLDNLNDYYDVDLKKARLNLLREYNNFVFKLIDITQQDVLKNCFEEFNVKYVVHLAAQAGVRYSLLNPHIYAHTNLLGFLNILEACRKFEIIHLVYASSSSVYGNNSKLPFKEQDGADHPISFYAATKRSNELMAHSYSHLYNLPTTGLRFFTVYGPWGRPDMAPIIFSRAIFEGRPLEIYNYGQMKRDFTYIDDIVEGIMRVLNKPAIPAEGYDDSCLNPETSKAPWRLFNIGNSQIISLLSFIELLEKRIGKPAIKEFKSKSSADMCATYSDISNINKWVGFNPKTHLEDGLVELVSWVKQYYGY